MIIMNPVIPGGKQDAPTAVSEWLQPVQWQTFATFEFPWNARPETARVKFAEMINTLERDMRTRVCFVNAAESMSKFGAPVPLHIHAALTAAKPISNGLVAGIWSAGVGRSESNRSDLALVEPYNPAMNGVGYIVKQISEQGCDWDCRNVHLFSNTIQFTPKTDHASVRSARRWQAQTAMLGDHARVVLGRAA